MISNMCITLCISEGSIFRTLLTTPSGPGDLLFFSELVRIGGRLPGLIWSCVAIAFQSCPLFLTLLSWILRWTGQVCLCLLYHPTGSVEGFAPAGIDLFWVLQREVDLKREHGLRSRTS